MASVCFYFQVHQPFRMDHYTIFRTDRDYFDDNKNSAICRKVSGKCYLPTNKLLLELIERFHGCFKVAFSLTGTVIEQFQRWAPEVLKSFQALAQTGCVEFLAESYYHSLSFLYSPVEFSEQIHRHVQTVYDLFGQRPRVFRNTELIYNNELARRIESMGAFDAILAEGADHILGYRSPNFVYRPAGCENLKLLLKNYRLSDDVAFRFSDRQWRDWPLTADKFAQWIAATNGNGYTVNLFMDYETFGEHQWADTGIFDFLAHLPGAILANPDNDFKTPSEVAAAYPAVGVVDVPHTISWADLERDLSAWLGNSMQRNALEELYALESEIKRAGDEVLLEDWRRLQASDHFYYMCIKYFADGDVHKYFNAFESPYDAYITFMNVLHHLNGRCRSHTVSSRQVQDIRSIGHSEGHSHLVCADRERRS
jgi:alpha-amylase